MREVKITVLGKDEKLLINLPSSINQEDADHVVDQLDKAIKEGKNIIAVAGFDIFVVKPDTKIVVDKSKLVETLRKL